jgi:nicotinamidase/pyrazinamidase
LDAIDLGFKTHFVEDACRGVNLRPNDVKAAIEQMQQAGVTVTQSADVLKLSKRI